MTTDAILTELRALPGAPDSLRERVRSLPAPQPRFAFSFSVRRALVVAAPAVVVLGLGAAALHGVLESNPPAPTPVAEKAVAHGSAGSTLDLRAAATVPRATLPPSTTRLTRYEAWLRVSVARDELASAARRAMQIARDAGGYVASVDMNTPGKRGRADLVLRIPNDKVQRSVLALGALGTVTSQHVRIADLQRTANAQQKKIDALRAEIAKATGAERAELERQLARLLKAHAQTLREGTLATVSVTYSVPQPAAAVPHHESRIERTFHHAVSYLAREVAWLVFAVIVFAPIALLSLGLVVAFRFARRRAEDQLLSSTQ
jgi:Domain of unknown function (DUF4349)